MATDIFDELADAPAAGDVFDQLAPDKPDIFDEIGGETALVHATAISPVQPPAFESPISIGDQGPIYQSSLDAEKYGSLSPSGLSFWQQFRRSDVGEKLMGPTPEEVQGMGGSAGSRVGILPVLGATSPLLPVGIGGLAGKALMTYFAADLAKQQPEVYREAKAATERGDWSEFGKIVGEDVFSAAITALGLRQVFTSGGTGRPMPDLETMKRANVPGSVTVAPAERLALTEGTPESTVAPQSAPRQIGPVIVPPTPETIPVARLEIAAPPPTPEPPVVPPSSMTVEDHAARYPVIKSDVLVDGREQLNPGQVPNMSSIGSSIDNPKILPGIREVPMSHFPGINGRHYSVEGQKKIDALSEEIKASGQISPLIVVIDSDGPYVLEGSTRIDALFKLGAKSFPAKVVLDIGDIEKPKAHVVPPRAVEPAVAPAEKPAAPVPPTGDRLVTVERPDGTRYLAAFGDKFWPGEVPSVAKLNGQGKWSHGMTGKGEKIIEDGGNGALEPPKPASAPPPAAAPAPPTAGETLRQRMDREAEAEKIKAQNEWPTLHDKLVEASGLDSALLQKAFDLPGKNESTHHSEYRGLSNKLSRSLPGGYFGKLYDLLAPEQNQGRFMWGGTADAPKLGFDPQVPGGRPDPVVTRKVFDIFNKMRASLGMEPLPDLFGFEKPAPPTSSVVLSAPVDTSVPIKPTTLKKGTKTARETDDQFLKRMAGKLDAGETPTHTESKRYNKLTKGPAPQEVGISSGPGVASPQKGSASLVNPPEGPTQLYSGIPIPEVPQALADAVKKTRDTIRTIAKTKGVRATMAYTKDVAGNVATVYGQRIGNNVRGELKRAMGRVTKPNVLDETALTFAREADGDRGQLAVMRGKLTASTLADPKWKALAIKAIDHAEANWDRINPIAQQYERATDAQITAEHAAGINTLSRKGYVMHAQDVQNDFGFFSDVAGEGGAGFKHARAYATFADSIASGVDPKSINAVALLTQRVARGQMLINNRAWVEGLKTTIDPLTRKPVITEPDVISRGPGLPPDVRAPSPEYVTEIAGRRPIAILKPYAGIFKALTQPSKFSESLGWNATLKVATTGKHVALMLDTFHLGRIAFWESIIKPLSFTDPKLPLPSYKRGVLTLDYSRAELQRMATSGEINPKHLNAILDAQRDVNGLVKHGYNVAKISDQLHQEWLQKIPITGHVNKFIFNLFQRGAMAEVGSLEVGRYRRMHPSWSDEQVYREVAKDLNIRFGNLGRQGWFKSKTAQDTARLLALAPQWNEGLIKSEVGAVTGAVKGVGSSIKEGRLSFGILPRAIGAMLLGQFAANQIINYITRGKPTWENEEEGLGAKLSAWVPDVIGNGPGFFLHPAGLAAEITHLLTTKYEKKGDLREALMSFIGGRYSTLARPLATFLTRHDVFGKLIRPENIWKETAKSALPTPIGASAAVPAIKQLVTGEKKESFPGQYQKQMMASGGFKTDQAPSPGQRIQALASHFRKSNGIAESGEFYESAYSPLRQALQRGAVKEAKQAYDDLIKTDHKESQIAAAIRPWTGGNVLKNGRVTPTNPKPFSGSSKHEADFLDTLTPEQLKTAEKAYAERVRIFRVFQDMLE